VKSAIVAVLIVIVMFFFIASMGPFEPKEFVSEREVLNSSSMIFSYNIIRYPTSAEVLQYSGENISMGFVTDPWNIKFGSVIGNGTTVKRFIGIKSSAGKYSRINIRAYGNITPMVGFSKNNFILSENESVAIEVMFDTQNASYGNYSGEIDVVSKTPKYNLLQIIT
jgi:hypothetical protein